MKKFTLKASVLAIAAALPGMVLAAPVDMDAASPVTVVYASEQTITTDADLVDGVGADLTATVTTGASFGVDAQAYVRVDLTGGTFGTNAPTITADSDTTLANAGALSQGGADGDTYAVFQISPAATEYLTAAGATVIDTNGLTVTTTSGVTLRYRLYETLTAAVNQTANTSLKDKSVAFVDFDNAVTATSTASNQTADVSATGGAYTDFIGATGIEPLAAISAVEDTAIYLHGGAAVSAGDILADTNAISVSGDFSSAQNDDGTYTGAALTRVTLNDADDCSGAATNASTLSASTATFAGVTAAALDAGRWLCLEPEGTPAMATSTFTGTLDLVPQTGFSVSDASLNIGSLLRNGTVLKAPMMTGAGGQFTYAQLANMSSSDATYTVTCYGPTGDSSEGTGGTITAGNTAKLYMNNLACAAGSNAVEIVLAVPSGNVVGSVVRQNATTGDTGMDSLVGNE